MKSKRTVEKLALIFSGMLIFQIAHSQEKYLPGYVINLKGDTIFGFIDYRNWKINPDRINFREKTNNNQIEYGPSDINQFKVKDEIYVSAIVNIETSPRDNENLNKDKALHLQADTTFLQTIYKGKKSLYYYFNHDADYFYIRQDTTFELLLYKRYLIMQKDQNASMENKAYLGQLSYYLNDCPGIDDKIKTTAYKQNDLSNLFKFYYECTRSEITFKKEIDRITAEFGMVAGVSLTSLSFTGSSADYMYLTQTDFDLSVNFSGGLFCDLILPRTQKKWSIYNELLLSSYKVNGVYEDYETIDKYTITSSELGFSYLKINNLVRYKHPIGNSYIFINGGISNAFVIKETNYKSVFTKFYTQETTEEGLAIEDPKKYEMGFMFGGGFRTGRFSLEARYEMATGMSKFFELKAKPNRIYVLLGFRF